MGNIIIAAFNEEVVIARTLTALVAVASDVRIIVSCNGCVDRTADIARGFANVTVIDLAAASKVLALRAGDQAAGPGPRIYLDADVVMTARAVRDTLHVLRDGMAFAARPPVRFDSTAASWPMRRWYAVRGQLPSIASKLWGAGVYGLSEEGRARFDEFPDLVSDDTFIDDLFAADEVTIVATDPVIVRTPRATADLMKILRRSYRTQSEVVEEATGALSPGQRGQVNDLAAILRRRPAAIVDVIVYASIVARARLLSRRGTYTNWERDESSRT
jgi:glycosyltransferase involved in cell wall biosynthesis